MSKELQQAKYFGFQLGIEIAKQLASEGKPIEHLECLKFARQMADREFTTTDPENSGMGFNDATRKVCQSIAMSSIEAQHKHAQDVCEGCVSLTDATLQDEE